MFVLPLLPMLAASGLIGQFVLSVGTSAPTASKSFDQMPCVDTVTNCVMYGKAACESQVYKPWAKAHCSLFCGFCVSATSPLVTTSTPVPTTSTTSKPTTPTTSTTVTTTTAEIIKRVSTSKHVAVTATTGMASIQLGMLASTLHHWAGIGDGRYSLDKLSELFDNDDKYASARQRISSAECLVIDEISMLSKKVFEMVEYVCRHVKRNGLCFGGMQVIGCGDYKQLPPVPNKFLNDDGEYCFGSPLFDVTFPHHVHLTKVIRQNEKDLAKAVEELCDGAPSDATIDLLKSLNENQEVAQDRVTRLYGTNFDVRYVNEEMLDELEGEVQVFKAKDEGNRNILLRSPVPKTLLLKEGTPVILIKNLAGKLYNGQRGIVHKLSNGRPPVINFNGELHEMTPEIFEVFDASQNKILASRSQIPVILAFAMTVHRAQGQTIENLEIDSASFFAPGQLGVAVGRAVCKQGLCIRNLNMSAAFLRHPNSVYEFYEKPFKAVEADMSCCSKILGKCTVDRPDETPIETDMCVSDTESDTDDRAEIELPRLTCPFNVQEFITANKNTEFVSLLSPDFTSSQPFINHLEYIHFKVNAFLEDDTSTRTTWVLSYKNLNEFLVGQEHLNSIKNLFKVKTITKLQNKMSSKLAFWIMDKIIHVKVQDVVSAQPEQSSSDIKSLSEAGSAKLRYIAGVCVHKIRNRLRNSVEKNLGKINKNSKLIRQMNYKQEKLLKALTISEDSADPTDSSMSEIEFKQNKSRGLTVVSDELFNFFKNLHSALQTQLTSENLHINIDKIHAVCRNRIDYDSNLLRTWIDLFSSVQEDSIEDELLLVLLAELYQSISEHFIKLSIVDSLKEFKRSIPRKKKQALRTKIQALGERAAGSKKSDKTESREKDCKKRKRKETGRGKGKKVKNTEAGEDLFLCPSCDNVCEEEPVDREGESVECDKCDQWYHYGCVQLTGDEAFLHRSASTWFCPSCSKKGKGRGKSTKK